MKPLRIATIGNYVPRQCGIATFTRDLVESMVFHKDPRQARAEAYVIAMNDQNNSYSYPDIVKSIIREDSQRDYLNAVKHINFSNADICLIQHEFGIFGGERGKYILTLIQKLEKPLVVTFHTVLKNPAPMEEHIIRELSRKAERVVVMSRKATSFLKEIYNVPGEKIELILHGVPDLNVKQIGKFKEMLHLENKRTLFTFGLLSRNKGIETVIKALPSVVEKYPDTLYIVLGKTHPKVVEESGEEYRSYLKRMAEKLNLRNNVFFDNRFISNEELFSYLAAVDVYITPYLNEAQITSGTLSYAIGAGAAVISTPYWHAEEILADGRGRMFDFNDSGALGKILLELFDEPEKLKKMRKNAYNYGRNTTWPEIGAKYLHLLSSIRKKQRYLRIKEEPEINPLILPKFDLSYIKRLTDNTGILQHASYIVPNYRDGYTLDDNARALLMTLMAFRQKKEKEALDLIPVYMSFISYMQNKDGSFHNFLGYNRAFLDEKGSEDSFGRVIWALGYLIKYAPNSEYRKIGEKIFSNSVPAFKSLRSLRGIANTIAGICFYLDFFPEKKELKETLKKMVSELTRSFKKESDISWQWFEPQITYDNGLIPHALFCSYEHIPRKEILTIAVKSMNFLEKITMKKGHLSPVGSNGWYRRGGAPAEYAQQPVDVMAMVLMFYKAFKVLKDKKYVSKLMNAFMWFLGENDLGLSLYDFETKGCRDGLEADEVSLNQGAESAVSYFIAFLTVLSAHEVEVKELKNATYKKVQK
ncbi:MAG: glycosyltransferase family 4 protein [Acidobacteriota bacterium]